MSKVIAALDTSMAAGRSCSRPSRWARCSTPRSRRCTCRRTATACPAARAAAEQVPLRIAHGPVVDALVEAAEAEDVLALVVGARGSPLRHRVPLGSTALAVATS